MNTQLMTQLEIQTFLTNQKNMCFDQTSINIFCDLHYVYDSEGLPSDQTFYSAIVQIKNRGKVELNLSCVNVRDKREVKRFRTWQSVISAFAWDDHCTVTFRQYPLEQ